MRTELEKKQAELIEILDRYYVTKTRPSLDELIESEKLKAEIAELEQGPAGQVGEDMKTLIDIIERYEKKYQGLFQWEFDIVNRVKKSILPSESKQDKGAEEKTERQIIMEILNCYRDEVDNYDCKFIPDYKFNSVALDILNELQSCFKEKRKEELISYHEWLEDEFENPVYNRRYINEYLNSK